MLFLNAWLALHRMSYLPTMQLRHCLPQTATSIAISTVAFRGGNRWGKVCSASCVDLKSQGALPTQLHRQHPVPNLPPRTALDHRCTAPAAHCATQTVSLSQFLDRRDSLRTSSCLLQLTARSALVAMRDLFPILTT